jgi:hypothetical protein
MISIPEAIRRKSYASGSTKPKSRVYFADSLHRDNPVILLAKATADSEDNLSPHSIQQAGI